MTKQQLGININTLRKERGVSTYKLRKQGVHGQTVGNIEKAKTNYTIDVLIEYLDRCGLELEVKEKAP